MILASDVMAKMAKAFFNPAAVHHMHAAQHHAMRLPRLPERFKRMRRHIGADIDFPAQFANIRHAVHPRQTHPQFNLLRGTKRVCVIAKVVW